MKATWNGAVLAESGRQANKDTAWHDPTPKPAAQQTAGYVAFWRGVQVTP